MPLQHVIHLNPHTLIGIWHLNEPEAFFTPYLPKLVSDGKTLESITHSKRRTEWLAGRLLVWELVERMFIPFAGIWTDEYNKPHLIADNAAISIAHAAPYVVAMLRTNGLCGIDIEKLRDKLRPLAKKFLNTEELALAGDDLTRLAILWGAKEALYKLHGRKSLLFKENLAITGFALNGNEATFTGKIDLDDEHEQYRMRAGCFADYVLVYTQQQLLT